VRRYRAIFFDLDHTLLVHEPRLFDMLLEACREQSAVDDELARRGERFVHAYFASPAAGEDWRRLDEAAYWQNLVQLLLQEMGLEADAAQCTMAVSARLSADGRRAYCPPQAHQTLAHLRAAGYVLGLLSNRDKPLDELCRQHGLEDYFAVTLSSGQVGATKPEPRIFEEALRRVGVAPEEAVYVGDNYFADVVGARRAGLTPILLDPDHLFPEAACAVIERIEQVIHWLDAGLLSERPVVD
jgi:HAD superfamily hydrolase (TIGR01662 family)